MIAGLGGLGAPEAQEAPEAAEAAWAARTMRIVSTASRGGRAHRAGIVRSSGREGPLGTCAPASRNAVSASLDARKRDLTLIFKRKRPLFLMPRAAEALSAYGPMPLHLASFSWHNGPTASRPNGPTAQRPRGPTFISSAGTLSQQWSCLSLLP